MNRTSGPPCSRWALIVLAVATLSLTGCGRKGRLDLPPTATARPANAPTVDAETEAEANRGTVFDSSYGTNRPPEAAKGDKKAFILDPLLGN